MLRKKCKATAVAFKLMGIPDAFKRKSKKQRERDERLSEMSQSPLKRK